jgi:hypothetical protein
MIKVFSGEWRGLGTKESRLGMIIDFDFRTILHHFHGAKLHVFMCIALHSDENGRSWPGYELIEKETGYNRSSIADALRELCRLEIDGHRVLMRYREKDEKGCFTGSNRYQIFPTAEEVVAYSQGKPELEKANVDNAGHPHLAFPNLENATVSINHSLSVNHPLSKDKGAKNAPVSQPVYPTVSTSGRSTLLRGEKLGDGVDCALKYSEVTLSFDGSAYPEDVVPVLREFVRM